MLDLDPEAKELRLVGGPGLRDLLITFIQPDAGAFGRDRKVPLKDASHAAVSYTEDGRYVDEQVELSEVPQLMQRARNAEQAAREAQAAATHDAELEREHVKRALTELACPVCGGRDFEEQLGREDSQWGMTTLRLRMLICRRCSFVLQFALGRSLFVPGGN